MGNLKRLLGQKVRRDETGVAAIEFAFISSLLAFTLMAVSDVGTFVFQRNDMVSSMKSGIDYFIKGGSDHDEAAAVIRSSWRSIPQQTTISITTFCECGNTVSACYAVCPDESVPLSYNKITISTLYDGLLFDRVHEIDEELRIR